MTILIKNGKVWDGKNFSFKDVFIEGNIVKKISEHICENADFIYDATGKIVSAGLVDVHVHMRGISTERFGIQAEMSCFPFGVTAANDAWAILGDKKMLDSFMLKNTVFMYVDFIDNHACLENIPELRKLYGDKAIGIKVCFDSKMSQVKDLTPLKEACEYARDNNLKVMVHCAGSPTKMKDIIETLNPGDILTHAFHGGKNNATLNDFEAIRLAKKRGVYIDVGMAANVHADFEIFKLAIDQGYLPDIISTDITKNSGYKSGGRYGLTMCMSVAKKLGMNEEDIFRAVTSAPAKTLGKDNVWGFLSEGRCADIAVFDYTNECFDLTDKAGNNFRYEKGYRCVLTVADGQIVYKD